jgi:hypothetical protein|tara:strand:- start:216 stop:593 length:378 start_codon:yes stop_codon:yes gene_type:complete
MNKNNKRLAQQQIQDSKVKKNAKIIAVLFWLGSSFYIYSTDIGFSDVYSWKPFVFFVLGPIFASIVFGNIIFSIQKVIEMLLIKFLGKSRPELIPVFIVVIFFCTLVAVFLAIFEFTKLLQSFLH